MIIGIDPSLTATGLCAIPDDWSPNEWSRVRARTIVTKPGGDEADRLIHIAKSVASFAATYDATSIFMEDLPRGIRSSSVFRLAKLQGVIQTELRRTVGLAMVPVNVSSVRKFLLGTVPRGALAKVVVQEALRSLGAGFEDDAQSDAFAVANWGRSELGLWAVCAA
jgi:Holliday junction resolvasome RuvABC endonuclease subunit